MSKDPTLTLVKPVQVAVDAAERVYVLEQTGNGRISVFDRTGGCSSASRRRRSRAADARWRAHRRPLARARRRRRQQQHHRARLGKRRCAAQVRQPGAAASSEIAALAIAGRDLAIADVGNKKIEFFRVPEEAAPAIDLLPSVRRTSVTTSTAPASTRSSTATCSASTATRIRWRGWTTGKLKATFPGKVERPRRAAYDARDVAVVEGDTIKIYAHDGTAKFPVGRSGSRDGEFSTSAACTLPTTSTSPTPATGGCRSSPATASVNKISDAPDAKAEQRRCAAGRGGDRRGAQHLRR